MRPMFLTCAGLLVALPATAWADEKPVPISPKKWFTAHDLRCSWHGCGREGTVRFELSVSEEGRVTGCRIIEGSGDTQTDQNTCRVLEIRARFTPATDSSGKPVASTYSSAIKWVIDHNPPETVQPLPTPVD
ncbi:energy transducer TonB [Erythrobacter aurantius]|uniref:energy transducer TonB n=1 Tax=Erythrobacter aurantius TaxID=2909249 RepID=UPI00207A6BDB|nr:energy transducer TonB [Erythrobacter aurantius]